MTANDLGQRLEAAVLWLLFHIFKALPVDWASAIGGWIGRTMGPHVPVSQRARRNLARALPELSEREREAIVRGMWDNLGRSAGEYPHLAAFRLGPGERIEVEGAEHIHRLREDGQAGLLFSAHLGNWELLGFCARQLGLPAHLVYRAASNRHVEWIYRCGRDMAGVQLIRKGAAGARRALDLLSRGEHIAMLVDQKMNDGIAVPFFGIEAMTAPALASFALKFRCPVVAGHIERIGGARFRLIIDPPVVFEPTGDRQADLRTIMTRVNGLLEQWIRSRPEQWLWLHRRWPE